MDRFQLWRPRTAVRAAAITVAWSVGLGVLAILWMGWVLGDGLDIARDLGYSRRSLSTLEKMIPLTTLIVWGPGVMAAQKVHRTAGITIAIAGIGGLLTASATMLMFSLRGLGRLG